MMRMNKMVVVMVMVVMVVGALVWWGWWCGGASVVVVGLVPLLQRYEGRRPFHCLSAQLDLAW